MAFQNWTVRPKTGQVATLIGGCKIVRKLWDVSRFFLLPNDSSEKRHSSVFLTLSLICVSLAQPRTFGVYQHKSCAPTQWQQDTKKGLSCSYYQLSLHVWLTLKCFAWNLRHHSVKSHCLVPKSSLAESDWFHFIQNKSFHLVGNSSLPAIYTNYTLHWARLKRPDSAAFSKTWARMPKFFTLNLI